MPARKPRQRGRDGDGSVYQNAKGLWVAAISLGGRENRRRVTRVCKTEGSALEALRRLRSENEHLASDHGEVPTLESAIKTWLAVQKPRIREKSWATYELTLRLHVVKAMPSLAMMRLDRIKPVHVQHLFEKLEEGKASPRVRELVYLRLRSVFDRWIGKGVLRNPVEKESRPRVRRKSMKTWTAEEARTFLDSTAGDWLAPLYRIALSVGMRRGELLGLRWSDVDLKNRRLHVQHTLTEKGEIAEPKTEGSRRTIELPSRAAAALTAQKEKLLAKGLRTSPWVFPDEAGSWFSARKLTNVFEAAIATAEVPRIRFHDLRHTFATMALSMGEHPKIVSETLGHSKVEITLDPLLSCTAVDAARSGR